MCAPSPVPAGEFTTFFIPSFAATMPPAIVSNQPLGNTRPPFSGIGVSFASPVTSFGFIHTPLRGIVAATFAI